MNKYILLILLLIGSDAAAQRVSGIYRLHMGMREGFNVWIVDGAAVRRDMYPHFCMEETLNGIRSSLRKKYGLIMQSPLRNSSTRLLHELLECSLMARQASHTLMHTIRLSNSSVVCAARTILLPVLTSGNFTAFHRQIATASKK